MMDGASRRATGMRRVWAAAAALMCVGFLALGAWQVQRLQWKRDLIARVDARVHAEPVAVPAPARWTGLTAQAPVKTPVFSLAKSVRSRSLLRAAASQYSLTPTFWAGIVITSTSECSGAMTM